MIDIQNLIAGYGRTLILKDVSSSVKAGEFIALLGPNGSGKSTLLKTLCGLISPMQGKVMYSGANIHAVPAAQRAQKVAYLAQGREAAAGLRVSDILEIGRAPHRGRLGKISAAGWQAIEAAVARTQIEDFLTRDFESLSGGEQARVLLARALVVKAPVLLADEPIAALDPYFQISMMESLQAEAASGTAVIAALHDLAIAQKYASRIWVMHDGRLAADDTPEKALSALTLSEVFGVTAPKGGLQSLSLA